MSLLAEIALVAAAALAVAVCLSSLPRAGAAPRRGRALRQPSRPGQLTQLESRVLSAGTTAATTHAYLRPLLAEIAAQRLAARGLALDRVPPARGEALLGGGLWDIVRPERPFPAERHGAGISLAELSAMVDVLERL